MSNAPKLNGLATATIYPSRFVTQSTTDFQFTQSTTGDLPIGISQEWTHDAPIPSAATGAAAAGQELSVYGLGQICFLMCGTGVTSGDFLKPDTNGKALVATVGTDKFGAQAVASGASGELVRVIVTQSGH